MIQGVEFVCWKYETCKEKKQNWEYGLGFSFHTHHLLTKRLTSNLEKTKHQNLKQRMKKIKFDLKKLE